MSQTQFFVVEHESEWKVKLHGQHYVPYSSQEEAINAAVDAARHAHSQGHDAQVLVQGANNKFRTEWTYGNEPYPPKG